MFQKAEATLLEEKSNKLFGITRILDNYLRGSYGELVELTGDENREQKIDELSLMLTPFTDLVARSFPGVGVGYYSSELDAILSYGPSDDYGDKKGVRVEEGHIGRQCMLQNREIIAIGSMVRGEIMNCVRPLVRDNVAIGFVWANETIEDIYKQIEKSARRLFFSSNIEPVLGLTGLLLISAKLLISIEQLKSKIPFELIHYVQGYLNTFLDSIKLGVVVVDEQGDVVFCSKEANSILGQVEPGDKWLKPTNYRRFFEKRCFPLAADLLEELTSAGDAMLLKESVKVEPGASNGHRVVNVIAAILNNDYYTQKISDSSGSPGKVILFEDYSQALKEEQRIQRTSKLATLGEIAASIAHEIRNPLAIVHGSMQILPQRLDDRAFVSSFLTVASQELDRVNNSIESLLDFARITSPNYLQLDINLLLKNIITFFEVAIKKHRIKVETDLGELPLIDADERQMHQAFMNLVLNAVQAMPEGGTLMVATSHKKGDKFIYVSIGDTGEGILLKDQDQVFDVFYSTKEKGTGLGLTLVHRVIDEHRGIIEFNSTPGQGTVFNILLPLSKIG